MPTEAYTQREFDAKQERNRLAKAEYELERAEKLKEYNRISKPLADRHHQLDKELTDIDRSIWGRFFGVMADIAARNEKLQEIGAVQRKMRDLHRPFAKYQIAGPPQNRPFGILPKAISKAWNTGYDYENARLILDWIMSNLESGLLAPGATDEEIIAWMRSKIPQQQKEKSRSVVTTHHTMPTGRMSYAERDRLQRIQDSKRGEQ